MAFLARKGRRARSTRSLHPLAGTALEPLVECEREDPAMSLIAAGVSRAYNLAQQTRVSGGRPAMVPPLSMQQPWHMGNDGQRRFVHVTACAKTALHIAYLWAGERVRLDELARRLRHALTL